MTSDPLQIALGASKPIPASNLEACRELLEVEKLVPPHKRRITIDDHARWQETGRPPHEDDNDIAELIQDLRSVRREGA